ncbi:hypothetical protein [Phyllobacterium chamaecytisi]|jgi:hypothetical protein|uniref:hypothetical protein n=1 Tax=Phyllobacterium chamaecytisi TaxID=2876082 RepID=UPI001CCE8E1D|nr:hypothetical protein [Phyllobacterium sp. KW56]MBZ9605330.1 hypothetical protein [Phyllobacterium sp. KW56]
MEDVPLKLQITALFDLCLDVVNAFAVAAQQGSARRKHLMAATLAPSLSEIDPAVTNSVRLIRRLLIARANARRPAFVRRLSN